MVDFVGLGAPGAQGCEGGGEGGSQGGEGVFYSWGDLVVLAAGDDFVGLQGLQGFGEHQAGNAGETALEFVEADGFLLAELPEDPEFPFPAEQV